MTRNMTIAKILSKWAIVRDDFQEQIDLAIAEERKRVVEMMYKFIRSGEFSGSFVEGCDCEKCDKSEIKSKRKFINLITNTNK